MVPTVNGTVAEGRILLVEDDQALANLIRVKLREHGIDCDHAATGEGALSRLSSDQPALMLLDYSLPDMNGLDLVQSLQDSGAPVPAFVMITAREDIRLAVNIMQQGAHDYLVKDLEFLHRLPSVVSRVRKEAETERKLREAQQALRESEMRLAKAQQIARMGSWEWHPGTGAFYCSLGYRMLLGLTPSDPPLTAFALLRRVHPEDRAQVNAAVKALKAAEKPFSLDFRLVRQDRTEIVVNGQGEVVPVDAGGYYLSGTALDITARKKAEQEVERLAYYDCLTGLPNRTLLRDRLNQAIIQSQRNGQQLAVMFLDLDRFKSVNDTLGHVCGDALLKLVAQRLVEVIRHSDTVARIGGDEFVIILNAVQSAQAVGAVAEKILNRLSVPVTLDNCEMCSTGSIGIALYPMDGEDAHTLLRNADTAMYNAKELERNNYQFFSQEMNIRVIERHMLELSMRRALERAEFSLHYQPQIDLRSGQISGVEALIRWREPDMGLIPTETFIPLAEETGLICPVGEWVLRTACAQNKAWQEAGLRKLRMAVNLSTRQFLQPDLVELVRSVLEETGLDPEYLELELTEGTIMKQTDHAARTLRRLKELGVSLSIDDFGTGFTSLSHLKQFCVDRLKIDRSFTRGLTRDPDDGAISEAVIAMGHHLQLKVVAEGVERREQLDFLKERECDEIQGFLVSQPLAAESFSPLLSHGIAFRV